MARSILTPLTITTGGSTITSSAATSVPLLLKGAASQSASLFEIRNSSNTLLSYTLSNGDWVMPNLFNSYAGVGTGYSDYQGSATSLYVRPTATTRSGAVIKGLASQSANLLELQDSTGAVKINANASGDMSMGSLGLGFIVPYSTYGNSLLSISTVGASNKGIVVRGVASQSANLQEWQSSAGGVLASLSSAGVFSAVSKSFVIDHPTKPEMRLRYGSLEGPENGVYVRGRSKSREIELPEYWTELVDESTITVTLTPIGKRANLFIKEIKDNKIFIGGKKNVEYFYTVFAERKDIPKLIVEE